MMTSTGRGSRALIDHTEDCRGDNHGMFTHTAEFTEEQPAPGLWMLFTCTDCGTSTWRNTQGGRKSTTE